MEENLQATDKHGSQKLQLGLHVHLERLEDGDRYEVHHGIRGHSGNCVSEIKGIYIDTTATIRFWIRMFSRESHRLFSGRMVTSQAAFIGQHWKMTTRTLAIVLHATRAKRVHTRVLSVRDCTPLRIRR